MSKIRELDDQLDQAAGGQPMPFGKHTRTYWWDVAGDDFSIKFPPGTKFAALVQPATAVHWSIRSVAEVVTGTNYRIPLAAGSNEPLRPVEPGEYLNISHQDGSTAIGEIGLILEGKNLPEDIAQIETSDEG